MLRKHAKRFGYHPNDLIEWMKGLDYECSTFHDYVFTKFEYMTDDTKETNCFFVNRTK